MINLKETMLALARGDKLRSPLWSSNMYIHLVDGVLRNQFGGREILTNREYELYKEPKKTIKLYQFAVKNKHRNTWFIPDMLFTTVDDVIERMGGAMVYEFKRLDNTMIEVDA